MNTLLLTCGLVSVAHASLNTIVTTVAGYQPLRTSTAGDGLDAVNTSVGINTPLGLYFKPTGDMFIGDKFGARIRKVGTDNKISTFAGDGNENSGPNYNGPVTSVSFAVNSICGDSTGVIYAMDENQSVMRRIGLDGVVSKFAGTGTSWTEGSDLNTQGEDGPATSALIKPQYCSVSPTGDVFFPLTEARHIIRKVAVTTGIMTRVAGSGQATPSDNGAGDATSVNLNLPFGVFIDTNALLYLAEVGGRLFRMNSAGGAMTIISGAYDVYTSLGDGGPATAAQFVGQSPFIAQNPSTGDLFITQGTYIRMIDGSNDIIDTYAGVAASNGYSGDNGPATSAQFESIYQTVYHNDALVVADYGNGVIRSITLPGPTTEPTAAPSVVPSAVPSVTPSVVPTAVPSAVPSVVPSAVPSAEPSAVPSVVPTEMQTEAPSAVPSATPSAAPSAVPSVVPTAVPSVEPTAVPSAVPSVVPSTVPSAEPTVVPSATPSAEPSEVPSEVPSAEPSVVPSAVPTEVPTEAQRSGDRRVTDGEYAAIMVTSFFIVLFSVAAVWWCVTGFQPTAAAAQRAPGNAYNAVSGNTAGGSQMTTTNHAESAV